MSLVVTRTQLRGLIARFRRSGFSRDLLISGTATVMASLLLVLAISIAARRLGPEQFGAVALTLSFTRLVQGVSNLNAWQVFIPRLVAADVRHDRPAYGAEALTVGVLDAGVGLTAYLAGLVLSTAGASLGFGLVKPHLFALYGLGGLIAFNSLAISVLRSRRRFSSLGGSEVAGGIVRVLLLLAPIEYSPWGVLAAWLFGDLAWYMVRAYVTWREMRGAVAPAGGSLPSLRGLMGDAGLWRQLLHTKLWTTARLLTLELDTLLVGAILGSAAAGVYRLSRQLALLINRLGEILSNVVHPHLSALWAHGRRLEAWRQAAAIDRLTPLAGAVILASLTAVVALEWQRLWGPGFDALPVLVGVFGMSSLLYLAGVSFNTMFVVGDRLDRQTQIFALATIAFFLLLVPALLLLGPLGGAMSHVVFNVIWWGCSAYALNRMRRSALPSVEAPLR